MKRITLAAIISLTVLTAACHKKVPPPTAQSPSPAPSAAAPDTPKPVATTARPAATPKETAPVKQAQTMTPAERQALNEALEKYAAVKDEVRELILLPGAGKTQSFRGQAIEFDLPLPAECSIR